MAAEIAAWAGASCPGVTVTAGYVEGSEHHLSEILSGLRSPRGRPPAVVIPLLVCPYPEVDEAIAAIAAAAEAPIMVAGHLGPHPLLAEALHARLSEGRPRPGRAVGPDQHRHRRRRGHRGHRR